MARIYRILTLLEGAPQGLSASEIRQRLAERDVEVSKRTVYRDLEALSDAGFPLTTREEGDDEQTLRWALESGTRISRYLALSSQELFALHLARGMLLPLKPLPLYGDLERAFAKIEEKLGHAHREHFSELSSEVRFGAGPDWGVALDREVLETVRAACAESQVLAVDYDSVNSGTTARRRLGPHYVYFARGSVYLVAEDLGSGRIKVFALPRMKNAVMEDACYARKKIDHEKLFENSFGVFQGSTPAEVRIVFSRAIASYVRERRWHSSQLTSPLADGGVEVSMRVAVTPELVQWVLGFGGDAQVLSDEDLRARVREAVTKMARLYGDHPA